MPDIQSGGYNLNMKTLDLHPWQISPAGARDIQRELAQKRLAEVRSCFDQLDTALTQTRREEDREVRRLLAVRARRLWESVLAMEETGEVATGEAE